MLVKVRLLSATLGYFRLSFDNIKSTLHILIDSKEPSQIVAFGELLGPAWKFNFLIDRPQPSKVGRLW